MINKYLDNILDTYKEKREDFERIKKDFELELQLSLRKMSHNTGRSYLAETTITGRIKTEESLAAKVAGSAKYTTLQDVTDIIGFRVILLFEDDIDSVIDFIRGNFSVQEKNTIDKRYMTDIIEGKNYPRIGYRSYHFVIIYEEEPVEIQIRSMLQHTWAEIEHDIGYKIASGMALDISLKRRFLCLAGMLEVVDNEFLSIKNSAAEAQCKASDLKDTDAIMGWTLKCISEDGGWCSDLTAIQVYIEAQSEKIDFINVPEGLKRFDHFAALLVDAGIDQLGKLKEKIVKYKTDILALLNEFCFHRCNPQKLRLIKYFYFEYIAFITIYREKGTQDLLAILNKHEIGYDRKNLVATIGNALKKVDDNRMTGMPK